MRDYKDVLKDLNDANAKALKGDFSGADAVSDSEINYILKDPRIDSMMNEIGLQVQREEGQS